MVLVPVGKSLISLLLLVVLVDVLVPVHGYVVELPTLLRQSRPVLTPLLFLRQQDLHLESHNVRLRLTRHHFSEKIHTRFELLTVTFPTYFQNIFFNVYLLVFKIPYWQSYVNIVGSLGPLDRNATIFT